jgi:uncharacterized protein
MSLYYLDSSALVKHYITEVGTRWVSNLVTSAQNVIYVGRVTGAEIVAAISLRNRTGSLSQVATRAAVQE